MTSLILELQRRIEENDRLKALIESELTCEYHRGKSTNVMTHGHHHIREARKAAAATEQ